MTVSHQIFFFGIREEIVQTTSSVLLKLLSDLSCIFGRYFLSQNFMQAHNTLKFPQSEKKIDKPCNNFDYQSSFCFVFFSMVLTESVKSAKLTLLAMTLWSSAMLFLFIMVLKQKKDSILLRMKKITVTETFLGCLKRNSS